MRGFFFSRGLDLEGQPVDPITDEKLIDLYNQGIPAGVLASLCAIPKNKCIKGLML